MLYQCGCATTNITYSPNVVCRHCGDRPQRVVTCTYVRAGNYTPLHSIPVLYQSSTISVTAYISYVITHCPNVIVGNCRYSVKIISGYTRIGARNYSPLSSVPMLDKCH